MKRRLVLATFDAPVSSFDGGTRTYVTTTNSDTRAIDRL